MTKALNMSYFLVEYVIRDYFSQTEEARQDEAEMMEY